MCNGDNPAVFTQSELAKFLLVEVLQLQGVVFDSNKSFSMEGLRQETIVNLGMVMI